MHAGGQWLQPTYTNRLCEWKKRITSDVLLFQKREPPFKDLLSFACFSETGIFSAAYTHMTLESSNVKSTGLVFKTASNSLSGLKSFMSWYCKNRATYMLYNWSRVIHLSRWLDLTQLMMRVSLNWLHSMKTVKRHPTGPKRKDQHIPTIFITCSVILWLSITWEGTLNLETPTYCIAQ